MMPRENPYRTPDSLAPTAEGPRCCHVTPSPFCRPGRCLRPLCERITSPAHWPGWLVFIALVSVPIPRLLSKTDHTWLMVVLSSPALVAGVGVALARWWLQRYADPY